MNHHTPITVSYVKRAADNSPIRRTMAWGGMCVKVFARCWTVAEKKLAPGIMGSTVKEGGRRSIEDVELTTALLFDFDNSLSVQDGVLENGRPNMVKRMVACPVTIEQVEQIMDAARVECYGWTTCSHTDTWPKSRLIVPLDQPINPEFLEPALEQFLTTTGLDSLRHGLDWPVSADRARLHFLPCVLNGTSPDTIKRIQVMGKFWSVDTTGMLLPEAKPAPQPAQRIAKPSSSRTGWWSDYPGLDLATFDIESAISRLGGGSVNWRSDPRGCGVKARVQCPWSSEHTNGQDSGDAFITMGGGRWPGFYCSHSSHSGYLGLQHIVEATVTKTRKAC